MATVELPTAILEALSPLALAATPMAMLLLTFPLALASVPIATLSLPAAGLAVLLEALARKPTAVLALVTTFAPPNGPLPLALALVPKAVFTLLSPWAVTPAPNALLAELMPLAMAARPTATLFELTPDPPVLLASEFVPQAKLMLPAAVAPCPEGDVSAQTN